MERKIKFKDLNGWLKVAIVYLYISLGAFGIFFILFLIGLLVGE